MTSNKNDDDDDFDWRTEVKSIPNLISLTRIAATPAIAYCIVEHHTQAALIGCFLAGASDFLDGYLAKHYDMATTLGTYLDPIGDKITINVLSVSLWYNGTLPGLLVGIWLGKDMAMVIGTYRKVSEGYYKPLKVNPTLTSKINTTLQFATLGVGIVHPAFPETLDALCWITGATTLASGLGYMQRSAFTNVK